jgi:hypothetical protein
MTRRLSLRRDVLQELTVSDLAAVDGGARQTMYSCLDYVSCYALQCVVRDTILCPG